MVVKCSSATARNVYADPAFKQEVLRRVESAFEGVDTSFVARKQSTFQRIQESADDAFDELLFLLKDDETHRGLKAKIAMDILDRVPETRAGEVRDNKHSFDPLQLAHAAKVAREMDSALDRMEDIKEVTTNANNAV
jgi:hypothetical protein